MVTSSGNGMRMEGLFFFLHRMRCTAAVRRRQPASMPASQVPLPCLPACCYPTNSLAVGAGLVVWDVQNVASRRLVKGITTTALDLAVRELALLRYMPGVGRAAWPGCSQWGHRQAGDLQQAGFHPLVCSRLDEGVMWVGLHIAELWKGERALRALSGTRHIAYVAGQLLQGRGRAGAGYCLIRCLLTTTMKRAQKHREPQAGIVPSTAGGGGHRRQRHVTCNCWMASCFSCSTRVIRSGASSHSPFAASFSWSNGSW